MIDPLTHMSTCPRGEVNLTQTPGLPIPPCLNRSLCLVLNKNTKLIHFYMPVESRATKSFSSLLPKKKKKKIDHQFERFCTNHHGENILVISSAEFCMVLWL